MPYGWRPPSGRLLEQIFPSRISTAFSQTRETLNKLTTQESKVDYDKSDVSWTGTKVRLSDTVLYQTVPGTRQMLTVEKTPWVWDSVRASSGGSISDSNGGGGSLPSLWIMCACDSIHHQQKQFCGRSRREEESFWKQWWDKADAADRFSWLHKSPQAPAPS